jgi:hypothetical protein
VLHGPPISSYTSQIYLQSQLRIFVATFISVCSQRVSCPYGPSSGETTSFIFCKCYLYSHPLWPCTLCYPSMKSGNTVLLLASLLFDHVVIQAWRVATLCCCLIHYSLTTLCYPSVKSGNTVLLLASLLFDPEDEGSKLSQTIRLNWYVPEDNTLRNHCYENYKFLIQKETVLCYIQYFVAAFLFVKVPECYWSCCYENNKNIKWEHSTI